MGHIPGESLIYRLREIAVERQQLFHLDSERLAIWHKLRSYDPPFTYVRICQASGFVSPEGIMQALRRYDEKLAKAREIAEAEALRKAIARASRKRRPLTEDRLVCSICRVDYGIELIGGDSMLLTAEMWEAIWTHREASERCGLVNAMPKAVKVAVK
jgi:hypothetical protein